MAKRGADEQLTKDDAPSDGDDVDVSEISAHQTKYHI